MQPHLVDLLPSGEFVPASFSGAVRTEVFSAGPAGAGLGTASDAGAASSNDVS